MRMICISSVDQRPFEIHGDEGVVSFNLKKGTHHMHLTYTYLYLGLFTKSLMKH